MDKRMEPITNLTFTFTAEEDSLDDHDTGLADFDVTLRMHESITPDLDRTGSTSAMGFGDNIPHIAVTPMTPPSPGGDSPDGHSTVSLNSSNGGSPLFRPKDFGAGNELSNGIAVNRNLWRSESPLPPHTEIEANEFFAYRDSLLSHVFLEVQKTVDINMDGTIRGTWLLTEIDSWNHEWERILVLCEKVVIIIKYDFIGMKIEDTRRLDLNIIDKVIQGELVYPQNSWTP